ncbi:hypothetical protein ABW21_db0201630 [Orbilia brochopaga]|nr:hypothetical protein ABW21_db0201630 [Drechslerella brochopaga]
MTVDYCKTLCMETYNLPFAGLESSKECYCGDRIMNDMQSGQTGCTMACAGDPTGSTDTCGGSRRLNVHFNNDWSRTIIQSNVLGWSYTGCWTEISARAINGYRPPSSTSMTTAGCISICKGKGYSIAGLENASECYCGNSQSSLSTQAPDTDCNANCPGNVTEFCGAANRLQVYLSP